MLVGELQGRIKVLPPPYTQPDPALFLQINNIGSAGVQQGIYDIVLDPNFASNRHYYVFYTLGSPNHDRVSRFTANASLTGTVPGSEFVLYEDPQNADAEHHGGALNFDNAGRLLFTTGEHFIPPLSQRLDNPRGKIHRINANGTVPTDNPFYDGAGPNIDSIWALGLRNPFRAYYDAPTGRYYIGDVGGNDAATAVEELNLGVAGANYGWPDSEGPCSSPCRSPLYSYAHNNRDAAITGGFVYRGTQFPASYRGAYFYADYAQNWIRGLRFDGNGAVSSTFNFEPTSGALDGPYGDIVYLAEGPDGALYYVDLGYSDIGGTFGVSKIRRIRYVQSNQAPVVNASATSPTSGPAPLNVAFSSAGSSDPEGQPLSYSWNFGDGATSTSANPSHTYTSTGTYQVRLTVSDGVNSSTSPPIQISVGAAPTATISSPNDGSQFRAGDVISYAGDGTDPDDGTLPASAFTWNIDFLHDGHVHPGTPVTGTRSGSFTIPSSGHDFSGNTRYRITLTVRDSDGLTSTRSVTVNPQKVNLTFDTVPSGRTLYLDGIAKTAPFTYDTLVGFNHTIEARDQTSGNTAYTFASWSDGGARQHTITVPASPATYTATYNSSPLASGLVGAWSFNEGSGATARDSSTNANDGTLIGPATWDANGRYGAALSLSGLGGNVTVPHSSSLSLSSSYTLEAWVKPTALNRYQTVLIKEQTSGCGYWLQTVGNRLSSGFNNGGCREHLGPTSPVVPLNQWSHLAAVFNDTANTSTLYLNGTQIATRTETAAPIPNTQPLVFGQTGFAGDNFERWRGLIDEVRVYNRALRAAEIVADMNGGI
jgi:glucose/arabinose dehydrogenase/PKD repeat protein